MSLLFCAVLLHIPKWTIIIHPNVTNYIFYRSLFNSCFFFFPFYPPFILKPLNWFIHCLISSLFSIIFSDKRCGWHVLWILAYPQIYFYRSDRRVRSCYRILSTQYFFLVILTWFTLVFSALSVIDKKFDALMILLPL